MITKVKKCKDCSYSRPNCGIGWLISFQHWNMAECAHPSANDSGPDMDLSMAHKGVVITKGKRRLCCLHRQDFRGEGRDCGPDAAFFVLRK